MAQGDAGVRDAIKHRRLHGRIVEHIFEDNSIPYS